MRSHPGIGAALLVAWLGSTAMAAEEPRAPFVDPFAARARVLVMTDIANEPDDQMSLVRLLLYSNQYDVEGLVATTSTWMNIRSKGPLGKLYPFPCCIHEGDTPTFLGLIDNGLASSMSPTYGGWGGRYVWRQPYGETRAFWTQGGDSYPGRDSSRDTVVGVDGRPYTSDQATIWRWRRAFQDDFAARMDWTIRDAKEANHNPHVVVNGRPGTEPLVIDAQVGTPVNLDAAGTADPDGNSLAFSWFFYPEAGTGIPGQPVLVRARPPGAGTGGPDAVDIPPSPSGGPPEPPPRVTLENGNGPRATVTPKHAGIAHVILAVEDDGAPALTSYRRVILKVKQ